jgi:hypothetical protein
MYSTVDFELHRAHKFLIFLLAVCASYIGLRPSTMALDGAFFSKCGEDFDEYVRRVCDPFPTGSKSRAITDLWAGRRFRIHVNGMWREGKVLAWVQWKNALHWARWSLEMMLEPREKGMLPVDSDHINASQETGHRHVMRLQVNRMNVHGGGTLTYTGEVEGTQLISLEWLDSALPSINLQEGVLSYRCPCCRAPESVLAAHEEASATKTNECPVCLETLDCRILGCGHGVCHSCWSSCRRVASNVHLQLPFMDRREIMYERAKRDRMFKASKSTDAVNDIINIIKEIYFDKQGLEFFWRELMVESMGSIFRCDVKPVICQLPITAIQIFLQVMEERKGELLAALKQRHMDGEDRQNFISSISFFCCDVIAEKNRQARRYRDALPWSELGLFHAKQGRSRILLAAALTLLGSTQQLAGLLNEAAKSYDDTLGLGSAAGDVWKYREALLREMEEWTGSSGKLTPGC